MKLIRDLTLAAGYAAIGWGLASMPAQSESFPNAFADFANQNPTAIERSDRNGDGKLSTGEAMSGWFHGNTANPSGKGNGVIPSISPGPHTSSGGFGTVGQYAGNGNDSVDPQR